MYKCDVCRRTSAPGRQRLVYKGVALCEKCHTTVKRLENECSEGVVVQPSLHSTASLIASEIIASFEQRPDSPVISWQPSSNCSPLTAAS